MSVKAMIGVIDKVSCKKIFSSESSCSGMRFMSDSSQFADNDEGMENSHCPGKAKEIF